MMLFSSGKAILMASLLMFMLVLSRAQEAVYNDAYSRLNNLIMDETDSCYTYNTTNTCSLLPLSKHEAEEGGLDPNLHPVEFEIFNGKEIETVKTMVYKRPPVSTYYEGKRGEDLDAVKWHYTGMIGKFFNLSPWPLQLYWDGSRSGLGGVKIQIIDPFEAGGTATFIGHKFYFTPVDEPDRKLMEFPMYREPIHVFDGVQEGYVSVDDLSDEHREKYFAQIRNLSFADQYKKFTGYEWLSMFPKGRPSHKMWSADYFGQQHIISSYETHFHTLPVERELTRGQHDVKRDVNENIAFPEYRKSGKLDLKLNVVSCAPRVFEIDNFLSDAEVDHIISLATGLSISTTGDGKSASETKTRSSTNTWVDRGRSAIVDAVYRRAADVLRINEALLRYRSDEETEINDAIGKKSTIAEALQLVHYDVGQEYTAHHDFGYPPQNNPHQPARFATLLLYLNEGMEGGETSFPRWINADRRDRLMITPKKGKAALFYSQHPDGNMDDLSQHEAEKVRRGEKYLMNLWVWDPSYHE